MKSTEVNLSTEKNKMIAGLQYQISSNTRQYLSKTSTVKGIKKLKHQRPVYLVEFSDYNRIWLTKKEFDLWQHDA